MTASRLLAGCLLAVLYGFVLLPLVVVVGGSLTAGELMQFPPQGLSLRWFARFAADSGFRDSLLLSLRVAALTAVLSTMLGGAAALAHRALTGHLQRWLRLILLLPLLLPELLTAIGLLFFTYRIGLGKTLIGLQIGHIVLTLLFPFLAIVAALEQVDPALEEAAISLGARSWQSFVRILLPLARPGVVTGALFAFITSFDMFIPSLLLKPVGGDTLPLALFDYLSYDYDPTAAAAATVSILLAVLAVVVIEKTVGLRRL
jgi:putative spermidine/putrescine transport system permease protein